MEFYGFTRKNNSSVVITIPSKLGIPADVQVKVTIERIGFVEPDIKDVINKLEANGFERLKKEVVE